MTDTQQQKVGEQQPDIAREQRQQPLQQIQQQQQQQQQQTSPQNSQQSSISPSNSISLIRLDELSSFGATKQSRLPALIKLNEQERQPNSMPAMNVDQVEQTPASGDKQQVSLPAQLGAIQQPPAHSEGKENELQVADSGDGDFQMVDMSTTSDAEGLMVGPSLPHRPQQQQQVVAAASDKQQQQDDDATQSSARTVLINQRQQQQQQEEAAQRAALASSLQYTSQPPSHLGDSLIDMVINLRTENQNLVRALETNNDYVKERISEFKRANEESKRRESQYALEKAEHEHQVRKLQRQNNVLSERLKSMEAKLKDMKLEISDSLAAARSSKSSSIRQDAGELYPQLGDPESFGNSALNQATTIQMDATSGELYHNNEEDEDGSSSSSLSSTSSSESTDGEDEPAPTAPPMDTDPGSAAAATATGSQPNKQQSATAAKTVGSMSKDELGKRFDADKAEFYAMDDPMKQCDKLEQQLNDIGKRDYEICLLQQQLNIYRQDYRLERMANLEAKIQIERLKNDIDRLCLDRLSERARSKHQMHRGSHHRGSGGAARFLADTGAADVISKLGHQLSKKASKSAAKAAKYAAKQAHREEKAAAAAARAAAHHASGSSANHHSHHHHQQQQGDEPAAGGHHHRSHRRGHGSHHLRGLRAVKSEVVNDLMSTANKAMLTGYKMASTHVNLALDKLSQFEQSQANNLAQNRQQTDGGGNKPMGPPSVD